MGWVAILPVAIFVLIWIVAAISDRESGKDEKQRRVIGTVMAGWEGVWRPGIQAANEYRKAVHDEEDAQGAKRPLVFTGVGDDLVEIRQVEAEQTQSDAVTCIATVGGRPVARLSFWRAEGEEHGFGMSRAEGEELNPSVARRIDRLLLAYLFEMEAADSVIIGEERITPQTVQPKEWPFHLLLPQR